MAPPKFRLVRDPRGIWLPTRTHLELLLPKSSVARTPATPAADAIAYTQTTCSTGAMPTPQSSAANTMDKPCSPTWQAFTPTQPHKPGNKTEQRRSHPRRRHRHRKRIGHFRPNPCLEPSTLDRTIGQAG